MNATLPCGLLLADTTARKVASMPGWAAPLRNDEKLSVDQYGVAHRCDSSCWSATPLTWSRAEPLVIAMMTDSLCHRCHPSPAQRNRGRS